MTATLNTKNLDAAIALLESAQHGFVFEPDVSDLSAVKLTALRRGGRHLLEPSKAMAQSATRFGREKLHASIRAGRICTAAELFGAMAQGVRAHVLLLSREGGMGRFKSLSEKYAAAKHRKHGSRPITQASRALYNELAAVPWKARRK